MPKTSEPFSSQFGLGDGPANIANEPNPGVVYEPKFPGETPRPDQLQANNLLE